ncbi:hypothetical protein HG530_004457 [Fusarium avenaceum]|nr:hypothetical protein HG530_004457 [Fusarium avenaceum]
MANAEVSCSKGVKLVDVKLVKVSFAVNQHVALQRLLGSNVVADTIVGEVIKDFHGKEEARRGHVLIPVEDGSVDDLDLIGMTPRCSRGEKMSILQRSKRRRDFDDVELGAGVDLWVNFADVVENVEHEGSATGAHLVD